MNVIVDYGLGNLRSVLMKFERLKLPAKLSANPADILAADKLVLPGVGSFDAGMRNLRERGLLEALNVRVLQDGAPVLGICLGMQLFAAGSEEGELPGLGWIDAQVRRLRPPQGAVGVRVPHVGWNNIAITGDSPLFQGINPTLRYYFTHSYAVFCTDPSQVLATTTHGETFASVVGKNNILGTQFHPEKSHLHGLAMLNNFITCA